jgi:hypothetical protein
MIFFFTTATTIYFFIQVITYLIIYRIEMYEYQILYIDYLLYSKGKHQKTRNALS